VLHRTQLSPLLLFPNAVSQSHYDTQYKQYNQYNTQYKQYNQYNTQYKQYNQYNTQYKQYNHNSS